MSYTYTELANVLPFVRFIELQAQVTHPDCKKWVREIDSVVIKKLTEHGKVISVKYVPQDHGQYKDSGEISTPWLPDPVAQIIGEQAKAHIGQKMLFFQLNRGHSEDQPSGFREIVWIEPLAPRDGDNQPRTRQDSAVPPSEPKYVEDTSWRSESPADTVAREFDKPSERVAEHLGQPTYSDEPF